MSKHDQAMNDAVQRIARQVLDLPTLEPRGRNHLDFHELSVWQIREALEQAYEAGREAGRHP